MENRPSNYRPKEQSLDRPTLVIRQFLGDPNIRGKLVHTPEGDQFIRNKAAEVMRSLKPDEAQNAAKKLGEIAAHHQSREIAEGATILFTAIPEIKLKPEEDEQDSKSRHVRKIKRGEILGRQKKLSELLEENPKASNDELAEELKCSVRTVKSDKRALRDTGKSISGKPGRHTSPEVARLREQICEVLKTDPNASQQEIADLLGCKESDVKKNIKNIRRTKDHGLVLPARVSSKPKK